MAGACCLDSLALSVWPSPTLSPPDLHAWPWVPGPAAQPQMEVPPVSRSCPQLHLLLRGEEAGQGVRTPGMEGSGSSCCLPPGSNVRGSG